MCDCKMIDLTEQEQFLDHKKHYRTLVLSSDPEHVVDVASIVDFLQSVGVDVAIDLTSDNQYRLTAPVALGVKVKKELAGGNDIGSDADRPRGF